MIAAVAIRLDGIAAPRLDFNATRQYHGAVLARDYYDAIASDVPRSKRDPAAAARENEGILEPPVMELAAAGGFWVAGGEHLWIPRLLSALLWVAAGLLLWRVALRVTTARGAVIAMALFLFLPFGIVASRSFQPDPLMVMLLVAGLLGIVRYDERPTGRRFLAASFLSAAAVVSKPGICLLFLASVFLALSVGRLGLRRALTDVRSYAFVLLSCAPLAAYYVYGTRIESFLHVGTQSQIEPSLLGDARFWSGWFDTTTRVLAYPGLPGAVALGVLALLVGGTALAPPGRPRAILLGLIAGYCLYGLAFTYHISTHDYYSLPLIVIVALSVGHVGALALARVQDRLGARQRPVLLALAGVVAGVFVWQMHGTLSRSDESRVRTFERIGQTVGHSRALLFLDHDYGIPLEYYGLVAGSPWPSRADRRVERMAGLADIGPGQRFEGRDPRYFPSPQLVRPRPEFFVVTDLTELAAQPRLRRFLFERFPVMTAGRGYVIFDLRPPVKA
ncbi:MAG: hypothetical protein QOH11_990 [Solirubrobacteraceae bacterium]|nr:hypothetical protein [Solirubrobacteraceae bacterium]